MIHSFSIKNFHSIDDELRIDLVANDKIPRNSADRYTHSVSGARISLIQAFIGPNAAGKTNALRALTFLRWLFVSSFTANRYDSELPYKKFAGSKGSQPTDLSVEFEIDGDIYTYSVSMSRNRILSEALEVRNLTSKRFTTKKLLSRKWLRNKKHYQLEDYGFGLSEGFWRSDELKATSVITAASKFGHERASTITRYWKGLQSNIEDYMMFRHASYQMYDALRYFGRNEETKKRAENEARRYADLGINSFGNGVIKHKYGNVEFDLDPDEESSGTRSYIGLSRMIDSVLNNGGVAVIDEFDAYLHFDMFESLIKKFFDPAHNKRGGQLLMTTHNLSIFDLVDPKYQIILTEKNLNTGSTQFKHIKDRADANYLQRYKNRAYGAKPTIY